MSTITIMHSTFSNDSRRAAGRLLMVLVAGALTPQLVHGQGTIAEQRARLPPPATCDDPVVGIWRSHQFHEHWQEWGVFTLEIRRDPDDPNALQGVITNRSWYAGPEQTEPGTCQGQLDYHVTMPAAGSFADGRVQFHGTSWRLDQVFCGSSAGFAYNLDRFSGTIDPDLQEFQSVNNDGGRYIDVPTVFRRVECFEEGPAPSIQVQPPPFVPQMDGPGCSGDRR
jgi:hypothetical protein